VLNSNSIYVDTTGDIANTANSRLMAIIFTPDAANDQLILEDQTTTNLKLRIRASVAKNSVYYDFSSAPIVFPNGINIDTITSGAVATLIYRRQGVE
jgi:hypothetical protein